MNSAFKEVVVIIPFYRESISAYEAVALKQCQQVLSAYPIIAIKPASLNLPQAAHAVQFAEVVSFDDHFFESIAGYNHLLLSTGFYERFINYEFMLIYQLDAFVFKDELSYWCKQNFDYIGAPWIRNKNDGVLKKWELQLKAYLYTRYNVHSKGLPSSRQFVNKVGNGGLSLRRVAKFKNITISYSKEISFYLSQTAHQYNEDAFWSVEVNRKKPILNIPSARIGLKFAIELAPQRALVLNGHELPFGCHAWDKHTDFWRPIFKSYGFDI
jgi:hypothetical protein